MPLPLRRVKTYTSASGYVYQYYFVGERDASAGREYIFDVTRDRQATFAFTVILPPESAARWSSAHGRELSPPERYAASKMRLLRGFDELGAKDLREVPRHFNMDAHDLESLLSELGID
ncbi:MAG: hypothetical protein JO041_09130 [Acidobacteria bacterium]|nr:hypothetical protein [Acidobacteriota bacterium]